MYVFGPTPAPPHRLLPGKPHVLSCSYEPVSCTQYVKIPLYLSGQCSLYHVGRQRLILVGPPPLCRPPSPPFHTSSELLEEDVGEEYQNACGQQPDHTLVDGDDVLQGVDALLHGVGVDVVINGGADAPHRPYSIHQRFHGGRDH